jgi:hypothetical protein
MVACHSYKFPMKFCHWPKNILGGGTVYGGFPVHFPMPKCCPFTSFKDSFVKHSCKQRFLLLFLLFYVWDRNETESTIATAIYWPTVRALGDKWS